MRAFIVAVMGLVAAASVAQAKVAISVDKDTQQMTVAVDGATRYTWPVSTGNPSHETPSGVFRAFRTEIDHYSKEFDEAPMPHAIFFTKTGHAIHGTDSVNRLGNPASHGCVRLSRSNAATLYALVQAEGVLNTTVTLTGSSQVALARNPRPARGTAVARRKPEPDYVTSPDFDAAGNPVVLEPLPAARQIVPRRVTPQVSENGYFNPGDQGSGYVPLRGARRSYDAQGNVQQYYVDRGYASQGYAPQVYAPRQYYQRNYY